MPDQRPKRMNTNETQSPGSLDPVVGLRSEIETLRAQVKELRRQVGFKDETLARKNRELDALHYVWCDGGCNGGVHRWEDAPMNEEIVADAERNTRRLRAWWMNHLARKEREQPNDQAHLPPPSETLKAPKP